MCLGCYSLLDLQSNVKTKPPRAPLSSRVEREKPGTQHRLFVGTDDSLVCLLGLGQLGVPLSGSPEAC